MFFDASEYGFVISTTLFDSPKLQYVTFDANKYDLNVIYMLFVGLAKASPEVAEAVPRVFLLH